MNKKIRSFALVSLLAAAAMGAQAGTTNLLQSVTVAFTVYKQGPSNVNSATGLTNYIVDKSSFKTKDLITAVSATSNFNNGDVLVRATPVTNAVVNVTNLVPNGTNTLTLTNTSTSNTNITYDLITATSTNAIGDTNITFGTNIEDFGTNAVTLGTNTAIVGTNTALNVIVGTNTTVTITTLTNAVGENVGTNYVFVSNTLTNEPTTTNVLGTPYWAIYSSRTKTLTPISTNVTFDIRTRLVYDDGTNVARIHGETITKNHIVKFGTTDEIRTLVLSNATVNVKLQGYAEGHYVPVRLGKGDTSYSQDFGWAGSGSGTYTNAPVVVEGGIVEQYYKFLVQ